MHDSLLSKLYVLKNRFEEIEIHLVDPTIIMNSTQFSAFSREYSQLSQIVALLNQWESVQAERVALDALRDVPELREAVEEEAQRLDSALQTLEHSIEKALLPEGEHDQRSAFLEIRAGTGGSEAAIFAGDLFRMYSRYAERQRYEVHIISSSPADQGGYKEIIAQITGKGIYGKLKFESGGHRVQRVPETESQGRVHTSTCTVAVMPELPESDLPEIQSSDLRIDTFRSSGAGGQHVNTTDSAIRITHLPTGLVVECQDERSQHKNKAKALAVLGARIQAAEEQKRLNQEASTRRNLLGSGDRSDRIRTYNFPQGRVTDHRINLTLYQLNELMDGNLELLIDPLSREHQADQLAALSSSNNSLCSKR